MKILFLDDDHQRHTRFRFRTIGNDVTHVYTADEAIDHLTTRGPYDEVWLDHDLSEQASVGIYHPDERTGYHVACFIAETLAPELRPPLVIVHSLNPSGATRMHAALASGGIKVRREPFLY